MVVIWKKPRDRLDVGSRNTSPERNGFTTCLRDTEKTGWRAKQNYSILVPRGAAEDAGIIAHGLWKAGPISQSNLDFLDLSWHVESDEAVVRRPKGIARFFSARELT